MAAISRDEVAHLARLSRLALTDEELDHYATQLDSILTHVASITEVAADDVPPTAHPAQLDNVLRADVVTPGLTREAALAEAPAVGRSILATARSSKGAAAYRDIAKGLLPHL